MVRSDTSTQAAEILSRCTSLRAEFKKRFQHISDIVPKSSKNFGEVLYYWGPDEEVFIREFQNVCRFMKEIKCQPA